MMKYSLAAVAIAVHATAIGAVATAPAGRHATSEPTTTRMISPVRSLVPHLRLGVLDRPDTVDLAAQRGRVVVVSFWATWCTYCRRDHVQLGSLARAYQNKGVRVFGLLDFDTKKNARNFIARYGESVPTLVGTRTEAHQLFRVIGLPSTYIIGKDGRIGATFIGALNIPFIHKAIDSELAR